MVGLPSELNLGRVRSPPRQHGTFCEVANRQLAMNRIHSFVLGCMLLSCDQGFERPTCGGSLSVELASLSPAAYRFDTTLHMADGTRLASTCSFDSRVVERATCDRALGLLESSGKVPNLAIDRWVLLHGDVPDFLSMHIYRNNALLGSMNVAPVYTRNYAGCLRARYSFSDGSRLPD